MIIFLFFLFFVLVLVQVSFLPHFFSGPFLNLILIAVIFVNLFERAGKKRGMILAIFAGFLLDLFSDSFFGFWTFTAFALPLFIKFVVKKYFNLGFKINFSWKNT